MNEIINKMALEKDLGNTFDYKDGLLVGSTLSDPQSILSYSNPPLQMQSDLQYASHVFGPVVQ